MSHPHADPVVTNEHGVTDLKIDILDAYLMVLIQGGINAVRDGKAGNTYASEESVVHRKILAREIARLCNDFIESDADKSDAELLRNLFMAHWMQCHKQGLGTSTVAESEKLLADIKSFAKYLCGETTARPTFERAHTQGVL